MRICTWCVKSFRVQHTTPCCDTASYSPETYAPAGLIRYDKTQLYSLQPICLQPPTRPSHLPKRTSRQPLHLSRKEHPALGIAKLHALLLSENSSWAVSERRVRRILKKSNPDGPLVQHQRIEYATGTPRGPGLSSNPPTIAGSKAAHVYPSPTLIEGLDVSKWTTTVEDK